MCQNLIFLFNFFGDKSTFMNFAFELEKFDFMNCDELDKIIPFIIEDDPALHEAFKKVIPHSNYIL